MPSAEPRAREPNRRAHAHREPDEGLPRPAGYPKLEVDFAQGIGTSCDVVHAGGKVQAAVVLQNDGPYLEYW
jgi:hypothetical protein